MKPAQIIALCGTAMALSVVSPALAQTSSGGTGVQPDRESVRLAPPARTPMARQIDATAASDQTALGLFEGLWKVEIVMTQDSDSRWEIPVTGANPSDQRDSTTDRPKDRATPRPGETTRPGEPTRTPADRSNASDMMQGRVFTGYAESRVIMNGNVLRETMVLPPEAMLAVSGLTNGSPSDRARDANTTSTTPSTPSGTTDRGSGSAAVPQPTRQSAESSPANVAMLQDGRTVTSFLSLDAGAGTFTKVCMDEQSGQIKHETGTYETESNRIVFEGEKAGGSLPDRLPVEGRPATGSRSGPATSSLPEPSRPSGITTPPHRDPDSFVSPTTRRDSETPGQPATTTSGAGSTSRPMDSGTTVDSQGSWDSSWGADCRVVVDIVSRDERRVTVYKMDPGIGSDLLPGSPESGARDNRIDPSAPTSDQSAPARDPNAPARDPNAPASDQVRARALVAGQVVCQATYTRVSESEAQAIRQMFIDRDIFAAHSRD